MYLGTLRFWSLLGGSCVYTTQKENSESNIVQLHFDNNTEKLVVVTEEHNIIVYNPISLKPVFKVCLKGTDILKLIFFLYIKHVLYSLLYSFSKDLKSKH